MKLEELKGKYLAFVIDEKSRAMLLKMFPPKYERVICHHVTLQFNLSKGLTAEQEKMIGTDPGVMVRHVRDDGKGVQAIAVSVNGKTERPDGSYYHVTLSLANGRKPVESNNLKDDNGQVRGIYQITGKVQLVSMK
jgi:hypothetical protein